jgi:hypothetical protein
VQHELRNNELILRDYAHLKYRVDRRLPARIGEHDDERIFIRAFERGKTIAFFGPFALFVQGTHGCSLL